MMQEHHSPPFLYRLGAALQAFSLSLTGKAAGSDNVVWGTATTWDEGRSTSLLSNNFTYQNAAREGYMTNEVAYACISDIAESAAEPTMRVYDGDEAIEDHPARKLITQPNPFQSEFELWELALIHLMLAGNAFFQKVRSRSGAVVQLWPITPGRMTPVPDPNPAKFISEWRYYLDSGSYIPLRPRDVVQFKTQHPLNPYMGLASMAVAARAVDRDNSATDFVDSFFTNAAVPQGLLKMKQHVEEDEADRIRATWRARYSGMNGWHDVAVLDADTEYQRLGLTQQEMAMPDLTDLTETRICMIFKWPAILIGALAGLKRATYENIKTARRIAWEDTLSPIYRRFAAQMNASLGPDFGWAAANEPFRWDFSKVTALQMDATEVWTRAGEAFSRGGITRNEYRAIVGQPPDPRGDVYQVGMGTIEVSQGRPAPTTSDQAKEFEAYPGVIDLARLALSVKRGRDQLA